jgi:hypothetical protein
MIFGPRLNGYWWNEPAERNARSGYCTVSRPVRRSIWSFAIQMAGIFMSGAASRHERDDPLPASARPDEARIGYAPDDAYAVALTDRLVRRGYEVVKIVPALNAAPAFTPARQSAPSAQPGAGD